MLRKQLGHLIVVSLKYFFDLDHTFCHHAMLSALITLSVVKIFLGNLRDVLYDGLQTVHDDFCDIRRQLRAVRDKVYNSETAGVLLNIRNKFS